MRPTGSERRPRVCGPAHITSNCQAVWLGELQFHVGPGTWQTLLEPYIFLGVTGATRLNEQLIPESENLKKLTNVMVRGWFSRKLRWLWPTR